jgi:ABC-type lipoprotein export system ATPase subunit
MQGRVASARVRRARALHLLDRVGLAERARALPNQLSGGQRQRIAIARALANSPKLVLADEPTGALDSQSGEEILRLIGELNRSEGTTVAVVTHDRRVAQATQRILRMQDGCIVEDHRVSDPLEEDLRTLAYSKLGETILDPADAPMQKITPEEEAVLRRLVERLRRPQ